MVKSDNDFPTAMVLWCASIRQRGLATYAEGNGRMGRSRNHAWRQSEGWVYIVRGDPGVFKIGFTTKHPIDRLSGLQVGSPTKLKLAMFFRAKRDAEVRLHDRFCHKHMHGEWFRLSEIDLKGLHYGFSGEVGWKRTTRDIFPKVWGPGSYDAVYVGDKEA